MELLGWLCLLILGLLWLGLAGEAQRRTESASCRRGQTTRPKNHRAVPAKISLSVPSEHKKETVPMAQIADRMQDAEEDQNIAYNLGFQGYWEDVALDECSLTSLAGREAWATGWTEACIAMHGDEMGLDVDWEAVPGDSDDWSSRIINKRKNNGAERTPKEGQEATS